MRMTVSLPDGVARRFFAAVPSRRRSAAVARLIEKDLESREAALEKACRAANADRKLAAEVEEWQSFDDLLSVANRRRK
jgi:hypothetical protein